MFTDRVLGARVAAAALTVSLGFAASVPVQARTTVPHTVPAPGTIAILHSFAGPDGSNPEGALVLGLVSGSSSNTTVYGTAQFGGANGNGNIFAQGTPGTPFKDLFDFGGANGATPSGGLAGVLGNYGFNGPLFGVTTNGGKYGQGAIYAATSNGAQTVVYSFTGSGDGANPVGRLVFKDGDFYGTTSAGAKGFGTVFRYSPWGGLETLHRFTGGNDGGTPLAGLALRIVIPSSDAKARSATLRGRTIAPNWAPHKYIDPDLYGTTSTGGAGGTGVGTIFKISRHGYLTTLFAFSDCNAGEGCSPVAPGATPTAELATDFNGNLYGTTNAGGSAGLGEVFEYSALGQFSVVHDFGVDPVSGAPTTGSNPFAPVTVAFNGALYGTTELGSAYGLGNVFRISASGFALLYEFGGFSGDGASPEGALIDGLDGNLYGTTNSGGANGLGTVFAVGE